MPSERRSPRAANARPASPSTAHDRGARVRFQRDLLPATACLSVTSQTRGPGFDEPSRCTELNPAIVTAQGQFLGKRVEVAIGLVGTDVIQELRVGQGAEPVDNVGYGVTDRDAISHGGDSGIETGLFKCAAQPGSGAELAVMVGSMVARQRPEDPAGNIFDKSHPLVAGAVCPLGEDQAPVGAQGAAQVVEGRPRIGEVADAEAAQDDVEGALLERVSPGVGADEPDPAGWVLPIEASLGGCEHHGGD